jgi:hypothetical protein
LRSLIERLSYHTKKRLRRVIRATNIKYDWKVSLPLRQDVPTCEAKKAELSNDIKSLGRDNPFLSY